MIKIYINNDFELKRNEIKKIRKICKIISRKEKIKQIFFCELSIINNDTMKNICNNFYKKKITTDVLSFPNNFYFSKRKKLMGEIFVNKEIVISQAKELNHTYERELFFLIIHGILHLLGYDHQNESESNEMKNLQKEILKKMKVG